MRCGTCGQESRRIKFIHGQDVCSFCGDFSEAGGVRTDGLITRNSLRIRSESVLREGDTILPHAYNKARREVDVNYEFVKQFPDQAKNFYSPAELKKAGLKKLAKKVAKDINKENTHRRQLGSDVSFEGSAAKRQKEIIK